MYRKLLTDTSPKEQNIFEKLHVFTLSLQLHLWSFTTTLVGCTPTV